MSEQNDNPYESPRADSSPLQKAARRVSIWIAVPVTLLSACVAFCCSCFPSSFFFYGAAYGVSYPNSGYAWLTPILIGIPWGIGLLVAWLVGSRIWKALGKPRENA